MTTTTLECGEVLYHAGQVAAVCTERFGSEHSHSDMTAFDAIRAGTAVALLDSAVYAASVWVAHGEINTVRIDRHSGVPTT